MHTDGRGRLRARMRAFGAHLLISLMIFIAVAAVIVIAWFPGALFAADGGSTGILIVFCVDVILGPALTLIVYDPRKSRGKIVFDFVVIGVLQASALAWGIYQVERQRPVAAAWLDGAFNPVTAHMLRAQGQPSDALADRHPDRLSLVYLEVPTDAQTLTEARRRGRELGLPFHGQYDLIRELDARRFAQVRGRQENLAGLERGREWFSAEVDAFLVERGAQREDFVWVPFNGRYTRLLFALDQDARLVGVFSRAYEGIL